MTMPPDDVAAAFTRLLEASLQRFRAMTPEQQDEMLRAQRDSWVRGEAGMGSDRDEAEYRAKMAQDPTDLLPMSRKPQAKAELASTIWTCSKGHRTLAHRPMCICGEHRK